jgi:MoxR-like ATPase
VTSILPVDGEEAVSIDENQIKMAIDELNAFKKEGSAIIAAMAGEVREDISPVPLKKVKRDNKRGGAPEAPAPTGGEARYAPLMTSVGEHIIEAEGYWHRSKALFEWQDGPLVQAMKEGDMFVLDEINLAEDAVIERLNSVLESGREITLAEKGGLTASSEKIVAHKNFKFLATMNPGGDFGKRELSPALRSRFTEMWIPSANSGEDIALIVAEILRLEDSCMITSAELSAAMVRFMTWLNTQSALLTVKGVQISVREVLAWAKFVSSWAPRTMTEAYAGLLHGAHMVLLDGLGIGMSTPREVVRELKSLAVQKLLDECHHIVRDEVHSSVYPQSDHGSSQAVTVNGRFTLGGVGFSIPMGPNFSPESPSARTSYVLTARSVTENMRRILRAMQLPRPILLEGPPGVGKTSLIANLAKLSGHNLVRINLSEHSEISDLLGSDLPAPLDYSQSADEEETSGAKGKNTGSGMKFVWCDGVFLTALKKGDWVLLDELNLAPQSVLEGLNACLDHRGEVFLPEIGQSFFCPPSFRVFCAQNPAGEGGGRKGLPQSFLTRFSRVFVEEMDERDVREIAMQAYSTPTASSSSSSASSNTDESNPVDTLAIRKDKSDTEVAAAASALVPTNSLVLHFLPQMVRFIRRLQGDIVERRLYGNAGAPWEFNLRDIFRWCELVQSNARACPPQERGGKEHIVSSDDRYILADAAYMLFFSRLRTRADREGASKAFSDVFGWTPMPDYTPPMQVVGDSVLIGLALLPKSSLSSRSNRGGLGFNGEEGPEGYQSNPLLLAGLCKVTETLAHCVSLKWPALLIGPSGSGKRRCLRHLALATGTALVEFPATASTDSTELLGSFEQASAYRHLRFGLEHLEQAAAPLFSLFPDGPPLALSPAISAAKNTLELLLKTQHDAEEVVVTASLRLKAGSDLFTSLLSALRAVSEAVSLLCGDVSLKRISRNIRVEDVMSNLAEARASFDKCYYDCTTAPTGGGGGGVSGFEWVDGVVVRAVKNGHWLLIDNVNLCSASVLDRLNSLLEPGGTLLLTESGAGTILTPHPDFRVFFCMDPSHGEISRAMRNRCVEISLLVEGDAEVAAAFLLSQISTSCAPLLPVSDADTSKGLLAPLCAIYEDLASSEVEEYDAPAGDAEWDVRGSLVTSGISVSTFPRFRMFARLLRLVSLESKTGRDSREALGYSLKSVLPFLSLSATTALNNDIELRVRNMSVDDDSVAYPTIRTPLQIVLSSPSMQAMTPDLKATVVLLVMLSSPSFSGGIGDCLLAASRSVRDRATKNLSAFEYQVDATGAVVPEKGSFTDEARERARLNAEGTATVTALHILSSMEVDISSVDTDLKDIFCGFAMSLLVRSAVSQSERVQAEVQALLLEGGCPIHAESFAYWVKQSSSSPQMMPLDASLARRIAGDEVEEGSCVLSMLQEGRGSKAAALGAAIAAESLGSRSALSSPSAALAYGTTCSALLDMAVFDRWATLDTERRQREEVDDATSLSADSTLSSLFTLAYALHKRRIVADSSELQVLLSVHAALLVTDVVLAKVTEEFTSHSRRGEYSSLSASTMHCLKRLLNMRDMLSKVLCTATSPNGGAGTRTGTGRMPWEEIIVCVRWIKKSISSLMESVQTSIEKGDEDLGHAFLKICNAAHTDLSKFDRALGEYWNRPVLLDATTALSATSKLRLWKEGGHAAVPSKLEDWETLHTLRGIIQPVRRTLPSAGDTLLETVQVADSHSAQCTSSMRKEWLCLYSTFYWMHTNESALVSNKASKGPRSASRVDVRSLTIALQSQFTLMTGSSSDPSPAVIESIYSSNSESDVYGDADYPLLADKDAAIRVREEWRQAGELSASLLLEPCVIASLFSITNSLSTFLQRLSVRTLSISSNGGKIALNRSEVHTPTRTRVSSTELKHLSSQLYLMISLAVRYTLFDLEDFRELQTLLWSLEAVLALISESSSTAIVVKKNIKKTPEKSREIDRDVALRDAEDTLLSLCKVFSIQLEIRLQSVLSRNLVGCMDSVAFSYSSPTLKAILEPALTDGPQGGLESLVNSAVQVPWFWTISTGILRLMQPSGLETALRHVDARALYSHSIAGAGTVSALAGGGAVVTVATCGNAFIRLLQLYRLSVAAAVPVPAQQLTRLELLGQHVVDVLTSIRDFLSPEGFSSIVKVLLNPADISTPCALYQDLLDLSIECMSHSMYVCDLLKRCLNPVLSVLADTVIREAPLSFIPVIGKAWVEIGLLRLYLTLPQTPVDPATKSAVKARLLSAEMTLNRRQMQTTHLQAVLCSNPPVTLNMSAAAVTVRETEQQVSVLTARAVQRPLAAPLFDELFSELRGACDGLADMERILDLVTRTLEAFNAMQQALSQWVDATNTVQGGSRGGKGQGVAAAAAEKAKADAATAFDMLTVCAREELGWQGSVAAFVDRCDVQYRAYEDVTSPVLAALHNLSSGMRLTVGWCYSQAEDLILALTHHQPSRRSSGLMEKTRGVLSSTGVLSRGWKDVLVYPHSSSISLTTANGDHVSAEAISHVNSLLQCSDLLAARAFKNITDMRAAQGDVSTRVRSKVAPNPLLVDKICPQATLLLSLARLDYLIGGGTAACSSAQALFRQVLDRFVHAYLKAEDDRKKQAALKAALYQNKADEKVFESDDAKEELVALRLHFPDHLSEFRDVTDLAKGPDGATVAQLRERDEDDEGEENKDDEGDDEKEEEGSELSLSVDPQTAALLIGYHFRMVFLHTAQHLASSGHLWVSNAQQLHLKVHVGQREALDNALTSCSLMTAKGLEWGLRRLLSPGAEGDLRGGAMNALSFMANKCNSSAWRATDSSSAACASWLERLSGVSSADEGKGKGKGKKRKPRRKNATESAAMVAVSVIDRDLLLLLDASAEGPWHPKDFNADPHPEEVMLAAEPLRKLFDRATQVLQLFPGNELLVQVCKVAARISELHTSTPVGKLLMTVQLLLVKAQEWEQFAAKHVSLHVEMAGLSVLIGRWRELELKSWGQLLRCKEQSYVQTAMTYWFSLARSLNSPPEIKSSSEPAPGAKSEAVDRKRRDAWPSLAEMAPGWLSAGFVSPQDEGSAVSLFESADDEPDVPPEPVKTDIKDFATASVPAPLDPRTGSIYGDADGSAAHKKVFARKFLYVAPKGGKMTESSYLLSIFEILNVFLKRTVVGEFPTRLHLVRLFALQLHQDSLAEPSDPDTPGSNENDPKTLPGLSLKSRLARIVMGVWRYYQQFLPAVRRFQDILRDPIEKRLKGEVKIGKWDQLSTYGLIEHSERVHKKLNKVP